jgi:hypothetical protein
VIKRLGRVLQPTGTSARGEHTRPLAPCRITEPGPLPGQSAGQRVPAPAGSTSEERRGRSQWAPAVPGLRVSRVAGLRAARMASLTGWPA